MSNCVDKQELRAKRKAERREWLAFRKKELVKNVNIAHKRPIIDIHLIICPNTKNIFIQTFVNVISKTAKKAENTIKGRSVINKSKILIPQIKPATKQPIGTVTIPQSMPKNISLCCSLLTTLIANGIVKDTTHPIIEETT